MRDICIDVLNSVSLLDGEQNLLCLFKILENFMLLF